MSHVKLQSAVIMTGPGKAQVEHDISIPSPDYGQVLIKVYAVALNPSDWMALDAFSRPGAGMGYDFAGVVVEVGEGVKTRTVGDRVAGLVHGCMSPVEYSCCNWDVLLIMFQAMPPTIAAVHSVNIY